MNRVCLTGRLTKDPELRELSSGQDVVNIRIAVDNGRDREPTFVDVVQFGKGAGRWPST
jgi:single-stranded DNA-binding protein